MVSNIMWAVWIVLVSNFSGVQAKVPCVKTFWWWFLSLRIYSYNLCQMFLNVAMEEPVSLGSGAEYIATSWNQHSGVVALIVMFGL